jgi:RND family efflux transporter MFP subunit
VELDKRLEQLEAARRKLVWESKAELEAAEARVVTLSTDLEATRKLFQTTRSVSREDMDKKELEYKIASAERDRLLNAEARERIEYEMAMEQLRERQIIAPFDGVLTDLYLDVGEDCEPRQPVARVVDTSECRFIANMDAAAAGRLKPGDPALLAIESAGGTVSRTGTVEFVSAVVDPASGLQRVKIRFGNADGKVAPGVAGTLTIPSESR